MVLGCDGVGGERLGVGMVGEGIGVGRGSR